MRGAQRCLAAGLAVALAGCGLLDREPLRACPSVAVLKDAASATQFVSGPGRDLLDVRFEAEFGNLQSACKYDKARLSVTLVLELLALKGPAVDAEVADFPFFVSITDRADQILAKEVFQSRIEFARERRRAGVREEIEQTLQLPAGKQGDDFEVLIGFQLSPEQLAYNRGLRGQR